MNDDRDRPGDHGDQGAHGRTARHTQNEGVRQGVAEQRLQKHSGEREQAAYAESGQEARQSHFRHDRPCGFSAAASQRFERLVDADSGAANDERRDGHRGGQKKQYGEALRGCRRECRMMGGQAA